MLPVKLPLQSQNPYFILHIITILISYISFFVASLAAVFYLIQDSRLKNKQVGIIFDRFPDLFLLDKLNYRAIGLGFPILTFSIITGFILASRTQGSFWSYNPREVYGFLLWLIYALILHVRFSARARGKKVAWLSLFAFGVIIFTLFSSCA